VGAVLAAVVLFDIETRRSGAGGPQRKKQALRRRACARVVAQAPQEWPCGSERLRLHMDNTPGCLASTVEFLEPDREGGTL